MILLSSKTSFYYVQFYIIYLNVSDATQHNYILIHTANAMQL
jgi:hypothetical protein